MDDVKTLALTLLKVGDSYRFVGDAQENVIAAIEVALYPDGGVEPIFIVEGKHRHYVDRQGMAGMLNNQRVVWTRNGLEVAV